MSASGSTVGALKGTVLSLCHASLGEKERSLAVEAYCVSVGTHSRGPRPARSSRLRLRCCRGHPPRSLPLPTVHWTVCLTRRALRLQFRLVRSKSGLRRVFEREHIKGVREGGRPLLYIKYITLRIFSIYTRFCALRQGATLYKKIFEKSLKFCLTLLRKNCKLYERV